MKKILMILTSHRLDCFQLCIDMLVGGGSAYRFDRVVIMCSGVKGRHLGYVQSLPDRHPNIKWDFIFGVRGRGKPISNMQNDCVRKYPNALYFKLDEDTFVSRDWDVMMEHAYARFKDDPALSLLTAVVTNNQRGAYHLLNAFPELGDEFKRTFKQPIVADRMGPVWILPQCASFMIRNFLNLDDGNRRLREANRRSEVRSLRSESGDQNSEAENKMPETYSVQLAACHLLTFSHPFSINCICYDFRHWQEIGGVPEEDENGWGKWIPEHKKFIVLVADALVHHYSFFVQQAWLDRTSILEDIRRANFPKTYRPLAGSLARIFRIVQQVPGAIGRRIARK